MARSFLALPLAGLAMAGPASALAAPASELTLTFDFPKLAVAEYHRPYAAVWIEGEDQQAAGTLKVIYETEREIHGQRYLKELRTWWRKAGREMTFPMDGVSGATRAPGPQKLSFSASSGALAALPPGQYTLVVEAAREVGGHETVRLPFAWPAKAGTTVSAQGTSELGAVRLTVK